MPAGLETKITDVIPLDDFNDWLVKNNAKPLDEDTLKDYRTYLGPKDGQIVLIEVSFGGVAQKTVRPSHYLVRVKDGKAALVGINSGK
jgi:hypothetical protein